MIAIVIAFSIVITVFLIRQNVAINNSEEIKIDQSFPDEFKKIVDKHQLSKIQIAVTSRSALGKATTLLAYNSSYAVSITRTKVQTNFILSNATFEKVEDLKPPIGNVYQSPFVSGFPYDFESISGENPILKNKLVILIKGAKVQNLVLSDSVIEYKFISPIFSISDGENSLFFIESIKDQLSFDLLMLKKDTYLYIITSSYMQKEGSVDSFTLNKMIGQ